MTWGVYIQGVDFELIDKMGSELSSQLHCPVHYPAFNKRIFECSCNKTFPAYIVQAAFESAEWSKIKEMHDE